MTQSDAGCVETFCKSHSRGASRLQREDQWTGGDASRKKMVSDRRLPSNLLSGSKVASSCMLKSLRPRRIQLAGPLRSISKAKLPDEHTSSTYRVGECPLLGARRARSEPPPRP